MTRCPVSVVGMSEMGCLSLAPYAIGRIAAARVLVGTSGHLAFFPQFSGRKIIMDREISRLVDEISQLAAEVDVCVLASHDPLFFGIGSRIVAALGREQVEIIPYPSAMQFAFAALGERWDDAEAISLHGRPLFGLVSRLRGVAKAVLLTDRDNTPQRIGRHLAAYGWGDVTCHLCENLASDRQRIRTMQVDFLADSDDAEEPNLLILMRDSAKDAGPLGHTPDEGYLAASFGAGLITKREVRVLALSAMRLKRDMVVWDIGAGSGAVAIEAARIATHGAVYAIERESARMELVRANALAHHADNIIFVAGEAPKALSALPPPGAIFVGGSGQECQKVLAASYAALQAGGVMVVSAVTLDKIGQTLDFCRVQGIVPEVSLVQCARSSPLGDHLRYQAMNPIHLISLVKTGRGQ